MVELKKKKNDSHFEINKYDLFLLLDFVKNLGIEF